MPLAAAERGGHSLHPHTARLSLPLSLSISPSVCLCPSFSPTRSQSLSVRLLPPLCSCLSGFFSTLNFFFFCCSLLVSLYRLVSSCHLSVDLSNFYLVFCLLTFRLHFEIHASRCLTLTNGDVDCLSQVEDQNHLSPKLGVLWENYRK